MIVGGTSFDAEIYIECYRIVRCERDRRGEDIACYVKHDICFSTKNILSTNIEVIFEDLFFPKTKPRSVGIFCRPPKHAKFLQSFSKILS